MKGAIYGPLTDVLRVYKGLSPSGFAPQMVVFALTHPGRALTDVAPGITRAYAFLQLNYLQGVIPSLITRFYSFRYLEANLNTASRTVCSNSAWYRSAFGLRRRYGITGDNTVRMSLSTIANTEYGLFASR